MQDYSKINNKNKFKDKRLKNNAQKKNDEFRSIHFLKQMKNNTKKNIFDLESDEDQPLKLTHKGFL